MILGQRGNQYKTITKEQRVKIIQLIGVKKMTIKKAAEIVGVGASTARMIFKKYQKFGTIFQPKKPRKHVSETKISDE